MRRGGLIKLHVCEGDGNDGDGGDVGVDLEDIGSDDGAK